MNTTSNDKERSAIESLQLELLQYQSALEISRGRLEHLEGLFANVADAIFVAELDGRLVDVNPAGCTTLGYTKAELLALHLWNLVTNGSREEILSKVQNMSPSVPVTVRGACRTKSGQHAIVDLNLARCILGGQDLIVATCRDVTVQQQSNEALERALSEIRESESRLRRSEAYLAEAQKLSHTGSFSWNPSREEINWSAEIYRIYEYSPQQIKPTMELARKRIHPDDLEFVEQRVRESFHEGTDMDFEHRLLMANGTVKYVHAVARTTRDTLGGVVEFYGAVMDITAQRLAQLALESALRDMKALKDQFELAIDTIPGLVWSALADGYIEFLNERWRSYTGMSLAEASGWGWSAAIHPEDRPGLESYWRSVIASGKAGETEVRLRRFDGVYRWFLFRGVPLTDQMGAIIKWYGQTTDIDDLKRTEERLRHSEAFLTEAQRLSLTGSFGWNVATGSLVWSAETFCILGYEPSAQPTMDLVLQRVHPEDRQFVQQTLEGARREDADFDFQHRLMMPDGSVKHLRVMGSATKTAGDTIDFVGAVMDITQLTQVAQALRVSEHLARGQLLALTKTLTALSRESKPDKFLEHVLFMMCEELNAHSIGVWAMNDSTGNVELVANYEDDRLQLRTPDEIQLNPQSQMAQNDHPVWSAFFRGDIDIAYGTIDPETARAGVAKDLNGPWYDNAGSPAAYPIVSKISEHLSASGVLATICIPMLVAGKVTGFFSIRFTVTRHFRQEEVELTQAMAHQAMLAIRLMRLAQQSREAAVTAERIRMARDIHDTLAQGFTGVIVQLEAAKGAVAQGNVGDASKRMERASELARSSLREARRSVFALRPRSLQGVTLDRALNELLRQMTDGMDLQATFEISGEERTIPMDWEENLLRITQETLTNTIKHAGARTFRAILHYGVREIQLRLIDDGNGFDLEVEHDGFGLIGMKERVDGMSGRFVIQSTSTVGTEIRVVLSNPATH